MLKTKTSASENQEFEWQVAELFPPSGRWTETEYFALPETNRLIELAHGSLEFVEMPTDSHQTILFRLLVLLNDFLRQSNLGKLLPSPLKVRLRPNLIREPDIVFMSQAHAERIDEVWGVPDLVVEIHSPGTRKIDRTDKFIEYAEAGVAEYWMVDPEAETIEVYELRAGAYDLRGKFTLKDTLTSGQLPGLALTVAEVFKR